MRAPALALASGLLIAAPALGAPDGRLQDVAASSIYIEVLENVPPNGTVEVETRNLAVDGIGVGLPDTVISVFEASFDGGGTFVAGDDDCGSEFRSCVTVPQSPVTRTLVVLVRAYHSVTPGIADLVIARDGVVTARKIAFAGTKQPIDTLATATVVQTVRQNRGFANPVNMPDTGDTLLIAVGGPEGNQEDVALGWDNNNGVGGMSKLTLGQPCPSCFIIVGTAGFDDVRRDGYTTLLWQAPGGDTDMDGLRDNLERNVLATKSDEPDTDRDGIPDGVEVLGFQGQAGAGEHYPYMGADPNFPDIFLEVDHESGYLWTETDALGVANTFLATPGTPDPTRDIRLHIDIWRPFPRDATDETRFIWDAWGGADVLNPGAAGGDSCHAFTPDRHPYFHHQVSNGAATSEFGKCAFAVAGNSAHELGHNMNGSHGGNPDSQLTGNAIYPSIMNYLWGDIGTFSTRRFGTLELNPWSVNEKTWGTGLPANLDVSFLSRVAAVKDRWVDWNQDGQFSDTNVSGQINFSWEVARFFGTVVQGGPVSWYPSLAWLPGRNQYFLLTRKGSLSSSSIQWRTSNDVANCNNFRKNQWEGCATFSPPAAIVSNADARFGPVATWFRNSSNGHDLLLVYRKGNSTLRYSVFNGSAGTWSATAEVPLSTNVKGNPTILRDPTDANNRTVFVYAAMAVTGGNQVKRWKFNGGTKTFDNARAHAEFNTTPPTPVLVNVNGGGIMATHGYFKASGTKRQFMAYADAADSNIKVAVYNTGAGRWDKLPTLDTTLQTSDPFGFAYVPFSGEAVQNGRFYLVAHQPAERNGIAPWMMKTVGNDQNAPFNMDTQMKVRELAWHPKPDWYHLGWDNAETGMFLSHELGVDRNLRGTYARPVDPATNTNVLSFEPIADGRANTVFTDHDDFPVMRGNLACALLIDTSKCAFPP